jgi:hypothetical protein
MVVYAAECRQPILWVIPPASPLSKATLDFLSAVLMGEDACYARLLAGLHSDGMACPRGHNRERIGVHSRGRDPVLAFPCGYPG